MCDIVRSNQCAAIYYLYFCLFLDKQIVVINMILQYFTTLLEKYAHTKSKPLAE